MSAGIAPLVLLPGEGLEVLDQTLLPREERRLRLDTVEGLCEAIRSLRVRGAPLLGLCGAAGMALAATERGTGEASLREAARELTATRPTAVDLGAAVRGALEAALAADAARRETLLWERAEGMLARQRAVDGALAANGAPLLRGAVLTHCNTGALATGGLGTALAVIVEAHRRGLVDRCYATETRPLLQGARLTAWELQRAGVPATLLADTAAASLVASGRVAAVITGADRIAANGDVANKVGTYGLALMAARHAIPFYVAAPMTTVDLACPDGAAIPIEFREAAEVGGFGETRWAPAGIEAYNPAFDVTPADLVTAIITERGVARPPYGVALEELAARP
jgi:methylthioribose-1-phosphate isomerase